MEAFPKKVDLMLLTSSSWSQTHQKTCFCHSQKQNEQQRKNRKYKRLRRAKTCPVLRWARRQLRNDTKPTIFREKIGECFSEITVRKSGGWRDGVAENIFGEVGWSSLREICYCLLSEFSSHRTVTPKFVVFSFGFLNGFTRCLQNENGRKGSTGELIVARTFLVATGLGPPQFCVLEMDRILIVKIHKI